MHKAVLKYLRNKKNLFWLRLHFVIRTVLRATSSCWLNQLKKISNVSFFPSWGFYFITISFIKFLFSLSFIPHIPLLWFQFVLYVQTLPFLFFSMFCTFSFSSFLFLNNVLHFVLSSFSLLSDRDKWSSRRHNFFRKV